MLETIETKNAPSPIGPYSQAIRANGFIFVSGQIPIDPDTGNVITGDIVAQTHQVMKNLGAILEASGSSIHKIVKTTIYLTNLEDFPKLNQTYGEYVRDSKPARATVQVTRLPREVMVEIEAVALA